MRKIKKLALILIMALMACFCLFGATACDSIFDKGSRDPALTCKHEWEELQLGMEEEKCGEEITLWLECKACGTRKTETLQIEHEFEYHAKKEPTCGESGYEAYRQCKRCGAYENNQAPVEKPALGHDVGCELAGSKAATCQNGAFCARCGEVYSERLTDHTPALVDVEEQVASCTQVGWAAYQYCEGCAYNTYEEIPMLSHALVTVGATEATCTEDAVSEYTYCENCDYKEGWSILQEALGHDGEREGDNGELKHKDSKMATCQNEALCGYCGESIGEKLTNHEPNIVAVAALKPTCVSDGHEIYEYCKGCTYSTYKEIPAIGHDVELALEGSKPANCTEAAFCARCNASYGTALGHDGWREGDNGEFQHENSKEADCEHTVYCGICETYYGSELGHVNVIVVGFEATCTKPGCKDYMKCKRCGAESLNEEERVIPVLEHEWDISEMVLPTCTETGLTFGKKCKLCGFVDEAVKVIPALGHDMLYGDKIRYAREYTVVDGQVVPVTEDMLKENGLLFAESTVYSCLTDGYCAYCGEIYRKRDILGHTGGSTNCEEDQHCIVCDEIYRLAGTHTEEVTIEETYSTCTVKGHSEERTCIVCGVVTKESREKELIDHDHDGLIKPIEATETTPGKTQGSYCSMCKDEITEEPQDVAAHAHEYDENGDCTFENCEKHKDEQGEHMHVYKDGECDCGKSKTVADDSNEEEENE